MNAERRAGSETQLVIGVAAQQEVARQARVHEAQPQIAAEGLPDLERGGQPELQQARGIGVQAHERVGGGVAFGDPRVRALTVGIGVIGEVCRDAFAALGAHLVGRAQRVAQRDAARLLAGEAAAAARLAAVRRLERPRGLCRPTRRDRLGRNAASVRAAQEAVLAGGGADGRALAASALVAAAAAGLAGRARALPVGAPSVRAAPGGGVGRKGRDPYRCHHSAPAPPGANWFMPDVHDDSPDGDGPAAARGPGSARRPLLGIQNVAVVLA